MLYSKTKLGESFARDSVASKNGSGMGSSRNNILKSPSKASGSKLVLNDSRFGGPSVAGGAGNRDNTTMLLGNSVFLGGDQDRNQLKID